MNAIEKLVARKVAQIMLTKVWTWLQGRKVHIGGIALILTGLGEIAKTYSDGGGFSKDGWDKIVGGWLVIGARSAADKMIPIGGK